jgi:hypothetical protein
VPSRDDGDVLRPRRRRAPHHGGGGLLATRALRQGGVDLVGARPGQHDRRVAAGEELGDDGCALRRGLARPVDRLGHALSQRAVVVHLGEAQVAVAEPGEAAHGLVGPHVPTLQRLDQGAHAGLVHRPILARGPVERPSGAGTRRPATGRVALRSPAMARVGFLGPSGTFHEQALLADPELAAMELVPLPSIAEVLAATEAGDLDVGFVAIENSIEGTVNITMDTLAFETDLLVQREAVLDIELHLLAPAGTALADVRRVRSFPHATAQVRGFLSSAVPGAVTEAANSTSEAARLVGEERAPGRRRHRHRPGRPPLRARDPRRGHRRPPRQPDPLRRRPP